MKNEIWGIALRKTLMQRPLECRKMPFCRIDFSCLHKCSSYYGGEIDPSSWFYRISMNKTKMGKEQINFISCQYIKEETSFPSYPA